MVIMLRETRSSLRRTSVGLRQAESTEIFSSNVCSHHPSAEAGCPIHEDFSCKRLRQDTGSVVCMIDTRPSQAFRVWSYHRICIYDRDGRSNRMSNPLVSNNRRKQTTSPGFVLIMMLTDSGTVSNLRHVAVANISLSSSHGLGDEPLECKLFLLQVIRA